MVNVLESRHYGLEFKHKFCIFFGKKQENYCHLNMAHRVLPKIQSPTMCRKESGKM